METLPHAGGPTDGDRAVVSVGIEGSGSSGNSSSTTLNNVKWLDYGTHMLDAQRHSYTHSTMTDVTVVAGPRRIKAHQLVLSASSEFFCTVLAASGAGPVATVVPASGQMTAAESHYTSYDAPTIVLADIEPSLLEPLMSFIYTGSTVVQPTMLTEFMALCKFLKVKGLLNYACMVNGIQLQMQDGVQQQSDSLHPTEPTLSQSQPTPSQVLPTVTDSVALEVFDEVAMHSDVMVDGRQYVIQTYVDGVVDPRPESPDLDAHEEGTATLTTLDTFEEYLDDDDVEEEDAHLQDSNDTTDNVWQSIETCDNFILPDNPSAADHGTHNPLAETPSTAVTQAVKRPPRHKRTKAKPIANQTDIADRATVADSHPSTDSPTPGGRLVKSYSDATLAEAMAELQAGSSVVDVAAKFDIPRSTIYARMRCGRDRVYRQYHQEKLDDAVRFVIETGISLKEASQRYDVSKTVLWRALKKSDVYKPEDRIQLTRADALKAIQRGETLISISKAYRVPLATLHRDKVRLYREGKLPDHCVLRKRDIGLGYRNRLNAAVNSCRNGMPQKTASELHGVPKTTIWRHLQMARRLEAGADDDADKATRTGKANKAESGEDDGDENERLEEDEFEINMEEEDVYEEDMLAELEEGEEEGDTIAGVDEDVAAGEAMAVDGGSGFEVIAEEPVDAKPLIDVYEDGNLA